jgi:tRNA-specific 2-thiouridylase
VAKDFIKNELMLGRKENLLKRSLSVLKLNLFISEKEFINFSNEKKLFARIRYGHTIKKVKIIKFKNNKLKIRFYRSQRAITPGQSVVFYNENKQLVAGGIIEK